MNEKILEAITQLLQSGGSGAVYCWIAYLMASILKTCVICGMFIWFGSVVKKIIWKALETVK